MTRKILVGILVVLSAIRVAVPYVLLKPINNFLATASPVYDIHIQSFGLSLLRSAYQFEGTNIGFKSNHHTFLKIDSVDVSLSWSELFQGRVTTDVIVDGAKLVFKDNTFDAAKSAPVKDQKDTAKKVGRKLFPVRVEHLDVLNSSVEYDDLIRIADLEGHLSNVIPNEMIPISLYTARGRIMDSSTIKLVGHLDLVSTPVRWDVNVEMVDFDLTHLNPYLKQKVPLTFAAGKLDLYSEIRSEDDQIQGSVKPFLKKVKVIGSNPHFENLKHFGIEVSTALANLILRRAEDHVVATKVLFSYQNQKLHVNTNKAFFEALANGFDQELEPGIDNEFSLPNVEFKKMSHK